MGKDVLTFLWAALTVAREKDLLFFFLRYCSQF